MSNFTVKAINPMSGDIEDAQFLDDYFGKGLYAVLFEDGDLYRPEQVIRVVSDKDYPEVKE